MARVHTTAFNEIDCIGDCYEPINNSLDNLDTAVQNLSALNVVDTSTIDLTYSTSSRSLTASVKDNSIDYTKVASGMVLNCVNVFTDTAILYPGVANNETEIGALSATITPKLNTSKILIQAMINGEGHYDAVFRLKRIVAGSPDQLLGNAVAAGNRNTGISPMPYDTDNASTMTNSYIQFYDTPNTASLVTYRFYFRPAGGTSFHLNRSTTDTNANNFERASSSVTLLEIKG